MKTKLLLIVCCFSLLGFGQNTKMETFLTGTKVSFYPNKCGNTIPEAQGKLSFCDRANNLGVVERSYGLNDRRVTQMLPNYYNQDEAYITSKGLSIHKEDNTWENIPNIAIPLWGTTYIPTIQNGLILPDNKIIILAGNSGYLFNVYDRNLKIFTPVNFPNNKYPQQVVYDLDRNLTWAFASSGSSTYLFSYDGTTLTEISNLGNISISTNATTLKYKNNHIYLGNNMGLYKIDVSDYTNAVPITHYNSTTTPNLPYDKVTDLQLDANGDLWMANNTANNAGIVKFNSANETYDLYQLAKPDNATINISFQKLALDTNNLIWAVGTNYSGLIKLTFSGTTPNWVLLPKADLTTLGVPITYIPNHVYYTNTKFYFTTTDYSTSDTNNYEVIINSNNVWSGRNDDTVGNLSARMNSRFTKNLPDDNGGVWWFNRYDDIVVYRDKDDNHRSILLQNLGNSAVIDVDDKAIVKGGNPNEIRKIDFPNAVSIQYELNGATDMQRVGNQIWIFDQFRKKIEIYENNALITTYNLDGTDHSGYYHFAVDDENNVWFAKNISGQNVRLKKFDTSTLTSTIVEIPANISSFKKILATTNNGIWVIGNRGALYYQNGNDYMFLAADHSEIYNIWDATVDSNGKLYLLNNDHASITTIEHSIATTPVLTNTMIEGNNSLLPSLKHYRPATITIDSEGSIWTHASQNTFKLVDDDFATTYRRKSTLAVSQHTPISEILIYPNPAHHKLYIKAKYPIEKIELFSLLGKKMLEIKDVNNLKIDKLLPGMYIVRIRSNNSTFSRRLMIK